MASIAVKNPVSFAGVARKFGKNSGKYLAAGLVGSGALAAYFHNKNKNSNGNNNAGKLIAGSAIVNAAKVPEGKGKKDYQEVYNAIAQKIQDHLEYDGNAGFYGQLCRLSWHTSGTYDKSDNSGGSYSGSMIYAPEMYDPENNGLSAGRDFLTEFLVKYPWLSRGDLWTLGGVTAVQEAGGPKIPWRPGRFDTNDKSTVPEAGRLPDASKEDPKYVKGVFGRMGFNDQETVALLGAHCLGKCHVYNSGYDGPWTPAFNQFTNDFYVQLLEGWHIKDWDGKRQYEDDDTKSIMMLPTDMVLKTSDLFVKYVKQYAKDQDLFFADFSKAYSKLLELGVDFPKDQKPFIFDTLEDQDDEE